MNWGGKKISNFKMWKIFFFKSFNNIEEWEMVVWFVIGLNGWNGVVIWGLERKLFCFDNVLLERFEIK